MSQTIIKTKNLSRTFRQYKKQPGLLGSLKSLFNRKYYEIKAVENVNLKITKGEVVGFIGPNGAGKTTTLKMLSGILYPTSGEVSVLGYKPFERNPEFQKRFSLVMGQKSQLWWDLPAIESFILNKEIYEVNQEDFEKNLNEIAKLLEIEDILEVPVRKLSLGQRMKCELMASLIHKPDILFLDEPTIGLDVVVQKKIRGFLKEYNRKNETTILLTSHYMDDVQELCDRIIIISNGRIIFDGKQEFLNQKYVNEKYLKFVFTKPITKEDIAKFGKVIEFNESGLSATISVKKDESVKVASSALQNLPVDDLDISEAKLEDIISRIFRDGVVR